MKINYATFKQKFNYVWVDKGIHWCGILCDDKTDNTLSYFNHYLPNSSDTRMGRMGGQHGFCFEQITKKDLKI